MKVIIHADNKFNDYKLLEKEMDKLMPSLKEMSKVDLNIDNTPEHLRLNKLRRKKKKGTNKEKADKDTSIEILCGCNNTSERMSKKYASTRGIKHKLFEINWTDFSNPCFVKVGKHGKYNALAAMKRDEAMYDEILNNNGLVVFVTNENDKYVQEAIKKVNDRGLMMAVIKY